MKRKNIFLVALLFALAGCSATNKVKVAEYQQKPETRLPPISVFSKTPPEEFIAECEAYNRSALDYCTINQFDLHKLQQELKGSEAFTDVLYADSSTEYRLALATGTYMPTDAPGMASAIVAGATLMLAPIVQSQEIKVNASLLWHDIELTQLTYDIPFEARQSLLSVGQDTHRDIARSIASHIIRDLQANNLFSAGYLADRLKSTNYEKSLVVPEQSAGYQRLGFTAFNHPFMGARIDYQSLTMPMDVAEVYVYPVRAVDWSETQRLLEKESTNERQTIEKFLAEAEVQSPSIGTPQQITWQIGSNPQEASCFDANYRDQMENDYSLRVCIAIVEDKFVKIRHKSLNNDAASTDVERLATQLLVTMQIPGESPFMAEIREQWKKSEPL